MSSTISKDSAKAKPRAKKKPGVDEAEPLATPQAGDKTPGRAAWLKKHRPEIFAQLSPNIQQLADA